MTSFVEAVHTDPYRPVQRTAYRLAWLAGRNKLLSVWNQELATLTPTVSLSSLGSAYDDPNEFYRQLRRRDATDALVGGLETLFLSDRDRFERWLWALIRSVRHRLLYDDLVRELDAQGHLYARRLAALIHAVSIRPAIPSPGLRQWATRWRHGFQKARGDVLSRHRGPILKHFLIRILVRIV